MTQEIIVALIVGLAAAYAVWRWMPADWRRAAAAGVAAGSQRAGLLDAQRAEKLAASLGKTSGCGSCETCGSCATGTDGKADSNGKTPVTRSF
jgi:type II secretory pathway pseudopilin PulG